MRNARKLLALTIAGAMVLSMSTTVFADEELIFDGTTVTSNLKKTVVELPTSASLNFTLDPQGLASATYTGGKIDVSALTPNEDIILSNKAGALVVNKSSHPVVVTVSAKATGDAVPVADTTALNADTKNNVLLWVDASTAMTDDTTAATDFAGTVKAIDGLNATEKKAYFALKPAEYEVTQSGIDPDFTYSIAIKSGETGDGTKIQLGGKINLDADWTAYAAATNPKRVGVSVKFTYAEGTGDAVDFATTTNYITGAYGLIDTTAVPNPAAPAYRLMNGTNQYTTFPASTAAVTLTVDGLASDVTITKVVAGGFLMTKGSTGHFTAPATGNTITITGAKTWPATATTDDIVITYTEGGETKTITITGLTFG